MDGLKPVVTVPFLVKLSESQNNTKRIESMRKGAVDRLEEMLWGA